MKEQEFLSDVKHEIDMLMKYGTKNELSNLDLDSFDQDHTENCIYGQMTGSCTSKRAKILMDKSCIRVMHLETNVNGKTFDEIESEINGKNDGQGWYDEGGETRRFGLRRGSRNFAHLSVLEAYIGMEDAKIDNIIKYMKGKRKTLKL